MLNERLCAAIKAARLDRESIAQALRVDLRTIERWERGRLPHPRHRFAVAELLGVSEASLWPGVAVMGPNRSAELLGLYCHRAEVPHATWQELLEKAEHHIDLLGFALLFLPEQQAGLVPLLARKGQEGCSVRIVVADPESAAVRLRDEEEGLGGALPKRITTTLRYLRDLTEAEGVQIRLQAAPMYNSLFRFDQEMIVTPHLYGRPGYRSPAIHLRRTTEDCVFAEFQAHFESIWAVAMSAHQYLCGGGR